MTLDQIEICIKAAETKNFSKTAEELFTTQPTVSKSIAALESELGVTLFERLPGKRLGLTDAGKMYVGSFTRFKEDFVSTKNKVERLISNQKNIFKLGYGTGWQAFHFYSSFSDFCNSKKPGSHVQLCCDEFSHIENALSNYELDAILDLDNHRLKKMGFKYKKVTTLHKKIFYTQNYVDLHGPVKSLQDFNNSVFYITEANAQAIPTLMKQCRDIDFHPVFETTRSFSQLFANIEAGDGVGFFDSWGLLETSNIMCFDTEISNDVVIAWNDDSLDKYIDDLVESGCLNREEKI